MCNFSPWKRKQQNRTAPEDYKLRQLIGQERKLKSVQQKGFRLPEKTDLQQSTQSHIPVNLLDFYKRWSAEPSG